MELGRRRFHFRRFVSLFYLVAISVYVLLGLQPAEAHNYEVTGLLEIPSINLTSDVTALKLDNHRLNTPDTIVGSFTEHNSKIFLIGHSSTVFKNLDEISYNDSIQYNGKTYSVKSKEILEKSQIDMNKLLAPSGQQTLVIMTCAGEKVGEKDATHRLIVTAV